MNKDIKVSILVPFYKVENYVGKCVESLFCQTYKNIEIIVVDDQSSDSGIQEVRDYVAYTGDENIIHQGEHPVIPGLCMAAWLQQALQLTELDWRISFLAPVYAGDELAVYAAEQELAAYVGGFKVFAIKL